MANNTTEDASSAPAILSIRNLSCAYVTRPWGVFGKKEVKPVLNRVNLEMKQGEIFGIIGESGSGKSTLGKCVLGLINYEGEIMINGRRLGEKPPLREMRERALEVQAVFQDPGSSLNPVKSVGWILEEPLRVHGTGSAAERQFQVDHMMDLVGLDSSYKKRKPSELSPGQKQRVSIGAALMLKPGLIVADEPTSALDVMVGAQIINLFRELNEQLNLALLFISHNLDLVDYLCDRVAVLDKGRLEVVSSF